VELAKRGHRSLVASTELPASAHLGDDVGRHDGHVVTHDGVEFHTVPVLPRSAVSGEIVSLVGLMQLIGNLVRNELVDLVHVHYAMPLSLAAVGARAFTDAAVPIVTTLHGTDVYASDVEISSMVGSALRACDAVTAVSGELAGAATESFEIPLPRVIHNWTPTPQGDAAASERIRAEHARDDDVLLAHVSNFRAIKQAPQTVDVLKAVLGSRAARLLLVGDGPELPETLARARYLGVEDRVSHLGVRNDICTVLNACDLLVLPSLRESFSLVALEAASVGVPIVAYAVGGIPEIVEHGNTGLLAPPRNLKELMANAVRLVSGNELVQFGDRAQQRASTYFQPTTAIAMYEELYESLVLVDANR